MHDLHPNDLERRREVAVDRYILAFDQGDLETIAEIVAQAVDDPELDRRLIGINAALHAEFGLQPIEEQGRLVRRLAYRYLPSGVPAPDEPPRPVTVGEVAASLKADHAKGHPLPPGGAAANERLLTSDVPIPNLTTSPDTEKEKEAVNKIVMIYKDATERVHREHDLINFRVTWLVTVETGLILSYGFSSGTNPVKELRSYIPWLGIGVSLLLYIAILAALNAILHWYGQAKELVNGIDKSTVVINHPQVALHNPVGRNRTHLAGFAPPATLPSVFIVLWIVIIASGYPVWLVLTISLLCAAGIGVGVFRWYSQRID
jgi:hypothetical protein